MLETHKARFVLRGFEEDVKDEDVFASTTMTASVRMLLPQATDLRNEDYTVFTAGVTTAFVNAHMKDGDVVYANPPPEWQPETLEPSKGTVILATTVKSLWPEMRTETLARPSRADPQEVRLRPEHAGHLPVDTHTTKRVSLVFHVDDLLLAGTRQIIKEILTGLSRDLELKSSEVTTKKNQRATWDELW